MKNILWICPILMMIVLMVVFMYFGFTLWSSLLIAALLICPVIILYGIVKALRRESPLEGMLPHTRGMPLDRVAPFYDWGCRKAGLGPRFRQETIRQAALRPGERVLDVGCGTGVLTRRAAEAVGLSGKAVGIDPAPKMIAMARKNASAERSNAEFRIAVIEDLPFEDNSFDCVLSSLMLHHLPPDLKLLGLGEVKRVLRPGGRLVLVDIGRPESRLWWVVIWPLLLWSFTKDQVSGRVSVYFEKAGFSSHERVGSWMKLLSFWVVLK